MNKEKSHIHYFAIKLGVYAILAILVFIFREGLVENLRYFIGGLMLLYGLEETWYEIFYSKKHFFHREKMYLGFIETLLGIVVLVTPISYESVCIIWATWSILRESYEIKEVLGEVKHLAPKIASGLESIVIIIFSIMLIAEPTEHHAMIHMYLLLVELIFSPLIPLVDELLDNKKQEAEVKE